MDYRTAHARGYTFVRINSKWSEASPKIARGEFGKPIARVEFDDPAAPPRTLVIRDEHSKLHLVVG